jgi:hypothetical protein
MYTSWPARPSISRDVLTASQASQIHDRISPTLDYLNRLQNRMVTLRFKSDDPLFRLTQDAYKTLFRMAAELQSIERRIGK